MPLASAAEAARDRVSPAREERVIWMAAGLVVKRDRIAGTAPAIRIFPERARRAVECEFVRLCPRCGNGWLEGLTGTLLGRVLAHEIGHHLLGPEHSAIGLMRVEPRPRDVLARQSEATSLTDAQVPAAQIGVR